MIEVNADEYLNKRRAVFKELRCEHEKYLRREYKMNEKKLSLKCDVFPETSIEIQKHENTGLFLEISDGNITKMPITISLDKEKTEKLIDFLVEEGKNAHDSSKKI